MTLTAAELTSMRSASVAALPDTCTIKRLDWPDAALNPSTGLYSPGTATTVYTGACRIRPAGASDAVTQQGEGQVSVDRYIVTVPHDTGPVLIGDVVEITTSDDPNITSRSFRVTEVPAGSWQIDQRLTTEEVLDRG